MSEHHQPPEMPPFNSRINIPIFQAVGMIIIFIIPVLALFGLFGETRNTLEDSTDTLAVTVTYPTTFRFKMIDTVDVTVENISQEQLSIITIRIDEDYIKQFSTVQFTPSVKTVTSDYYIVEMQDVAPGETRIVTITIQAEEYGRHKGKLRIEADGAEPVTFSLATVALP